MLVSKKNKETRTLEALQLYNFITLQTDENRIKLRRRHSHYTTLS